MLSSRASSLESFEANNSFTATVREERSAGTKPETIFRLLGRGFWTDS